MKLSSKQSLVVMAAALMAAISFLPTTKADDQDGSRDARELNARVAKLQKDLDVQIQLGKAKDEEIVKLNGKIAELTDGKIRLEKQVADLTTKVNDLTTMTKKTIDIVLRNPGKRQQLTIHVNSATGTVTDSRGGGFAKNPFRMDQTNCDSSAQQTGNGFKMNNDDPVQDVLIK